MNLVNKISLMRILLLILLLSTNYCVIIHKNDPDQWKESWSEFESNLSIGKEIKLIEHYDRRLFNIPASNTKFGKQFKINSIAAITSFIPKNKAKSLKNAKSPFEINSLDIYSSSVPILIYINLKNKNNKYEFKNDEIIQKFDNKDQKFPSVKTTCRVVALIETKLFYKEFFDELLSNEAITQDKYNLYTDFESTKDCSLVENGFDQINCKLELNAKAGLKSYLESEIPMPLLKCES
ncbi:hypothetical protein [Leptospira mayottensis]|uniref:hypothetical protein n=1 Tax=Leptospira mayottensis TaxID=1137606 RepID=UPI000E35F770|nr:hypothetical protein [Leptospira mayottensis]AXR68723.1 hypothetical protein DPV73_12630 [Leptospira mayottensis]